MSTQDPDDPQRPEPPGAEPPGAEPPGAEPPGAEPSGAEPTEPLPGPQSPAPESPSVPGARRLLRSRTDRLIGGVCGGLGRHLGIDPVILRIAAVALIFAGGAGVLAYLAALLLVPAEPQPWEAGAAGTGAAAAPAPGAPGGNRTLVTVGALVVLFFTWPFLLGGGFLLAGIALPFALLVLAGLTVWWLASGQGFGGEPGEVARNAALGIGVLALCLLVLLGGGWAVAAGGGTVAAGLVIATGVLLGAAAFAGGLRWVMLPALSLAIGAGLVAAAGIDFDGGVGEREYRPLSGAEVRDRYELSMGELVVDLRNAELPIGDTPLEMDVGMGKATLLVPRGVCVASSARIGAGAVEVFDRDSAGVDLDWEDPRRATPGASRVVVDADVGFGAFEVAHERRLRDPGPHFGDVGDDYGRDAGDAGCSDGATARAGGE